VLSNIALRFQAITPCWPRSTWVFKTGAINHSATSAATTVLLHHAFSIPGPEVFRARIAHQFTPQGKVAGVRRAGEAAVIQLGCSCILDLPLCKHEDRRHHRRRRTRINH